MGYNAYACVVVGLQLKERQLYHDVSRRGCDHRETSFAYCPDCGKATRETYSDPIEGYEPDDLRFKDFDAVMSGQESDTIYIGRELCRLGARDDAQRVSWTPEDVAADLQCALRGTGLWAPEKFAVWVFLYESY